MRPTRIGERIKAGFLCWMKMIDLPNGTMVSLLSPRVDSQHSSQFDPVKMGVAGLQLASCRIAKNFLFLKVKAKVLLNLAHEALHFLV